VDVILGVGSKV
jgi:hypothetical protein